MTSLAHHAAMAAADRRVRDAQAQLLAATTARDEAAHQHVLVTARDQAAELASKIRETHQALAVASKAADAKELTAEARLRDADAYLAECEDALAEARRTGSPAQEGAAQQARDGAQRTWQERHQAVTLAANQADDAAEQLNAVTELLAEAEGNLEAAEEAVNGPGRAPVSRATLDLIAHWYNAAPRPGGLPALTEHEEGQAYSVIMAAYLNRRALANLPDTDPPRIRAAAQRAV